MVRDASEEAGVDFFAWPYQIAQRGSTDVLTVLVNHGVQCASLG